MNDIVVQVVGHTPEAYSDSPLKELDGIELAHIDGDHSGQGLYEDMKYVSERSHKDGCIVIVDNTADPMWPDVRELLDKQNFEKVTLPTLCGADIYRIN